MQENLTQFGLDSTESAVYLALLKLGPSSVTEITKTAGITRTLGYHTLEKLGWYGLVDTVSGAGKKKIYMAHNPRQLIQHVKNNASSWSRRVKEAEQLLPELQALYKVGDKPVIRYQEGAKGVISLFEESLEAKKEILSVLDVESWQKSDFWDWARSYNRERNRRKIKEKILILDTPAGRDWIKKYSGSRAYTLYRWVKPADISSLLRFGGEINVYDDRVMIALLESSKRMGIIIESNILANIIKALFELVWNNAVPVNFSKK